MKPYITMQEAMKQQSSEHGVRLLTEANGCVSGCASGITIYEDTEFNDHPGCHEDQEGFFVLEGKGAVKLDEEEFLIGPGDSFIAAPGVYHTVKCSQQGQPVKVFWFHSAVTPL